MWLWGVWLCAHPTTWESGDLDQVPAPWFPTCHMVVITGLSGRLKENLRDVLSSLVLGNYGLNRYT